MPIRKNKSFVYKNSIDEVRVLLSIGLTGDIEK